MGKSCGRYLSYFLIVFLALAFGGCSDSFDNEYEEKAVVDKIIELAEKAKANISDVEKAQGYAENMLKLAKEVDAKSYMGDAYNILGSVNREKEKYVVALKHFLQSAKSFEQASDTLGMSKVYNNIGNIYRDIHQYDKAIVYYQKRLTLATLLKDKVRMAVTNRNMAFTYQLMEDYEKAKDSYWTSLYIWKTLKDEVRMAQLYNDLGIVYDLFLDNNNAPSYIAEKNIIYNLHLNSLELNKKLDNQKGVGWAFNNIGVSLLEKEDYDSALVYFNRALSLKEEIGDYEGLGATYNNLGYLYLSRNEEQHKAIGYLKLAERYAQEEELEKTYEYLISAYEDQGNYVEANHCLKKMDSLKKELLKNSHKEELARIEARYAIEYAGL